MFQTLSAQALILQVINALLLIVVWLRETIQQLDTLAQTENITKDHEGSRHPPFHHQMPVRPIQIADFTFAQGVHHMSAFANSCEALKLLAIIPCANKLGSDHTRLTYGNRLLVSCGQTLASSPATAQTQVDELALKYF